MLTSVRELTEELEAKSHAGLAAMLQDHTFVGVVDEELSVLQQGTKLVLVQHGAYARALFYEQVLRLFGNAAPIRIDPPLDVETLVELAAEAQPEEFGTTAAERSALAREVADLLASKAPMLEEYFSLRFRVEEGEGRAASAPQSTHRRVWLETIPRLVDGHTPQVQGLPEFLLGLAISVDWATEKECFRTVARALAGFYAQLPRIPAEFHAALRAPASEDPARERAWEEHRVQPESLYATVEHVLFPALRRGFHPPRALADRHRTVQIACTEQLYRIFERC